MNRLVLIDGKSVFYRGYYAMGALSLPDGTPTGGVYGFAAISMEIVKKLNPTKVVVAWDSKTSTSKRKALYQDYKAGRVKPGEDFYAQIPLLKELIKDLGWSFVELDDYEADDIIGTLSLQADNAGDYETYIISSDLDMLQIVDENTHMWRILKGFSNIEQIDIKEIEEKYGIKKSQFLDLKSLKGDASDNIPGVPGIGEKTAAKLLNDYGDLDGIYNNIDKITGSTKAKLEAGKDSAYLSKKLAEIMFDAPIKLATIPNFEFNKGNVITGLKKLQFNSLIRKIGGDGTVFSRESGARQREDERARPVADRPLGRGRPEGSTGASDAARENTVPSPDPSQESTFLDSTAQASRENTIPSPKPAIIDWDIKALMHENPEITKEIEQGKEYWDLGQAAFLINPLDRSQSDTYDPMDLMSAYKTEREELSKYPKLYNIYMDFDLPLIPVLYKMEEKGMLLDRQYFAKLRVEYEEEVKKS